MSKVPYAGYLGTMSNTMSCKRQMYSEAPYLQMGKSKLRVFNYLYMERYLGSKWMSAPHELTSSHSLVEAGDVSRYFNQPQITFSTTPLNNR